MKIVYYYRGIPSDTALVNMTEMINALRQVGHEVIPCFPIQEGNAGPESGSGRLLWMRRRVPRAVWNLGQLWADRRGTRGLLSSSELGPPDLMHDRYLALSSGARTVARCLGVRLLTLAHDWPAHQMSEKFRYHFRPVVGADWRSGRRRKVSSARRRHRWFPDHEPPALRSGQGPIAKY